MNKQYCAISAKLKAMYSSCLSDEDYECILTKRTVNDVCNYLKSSTAYQEVLAQVDERNIHRGSMEAILKNELYGQYVRLYSFMNQPQRKIMKFWFMRTEIEYLKHKIRYIFNHESPEEFQEDYNGYADFFLAHTKIDSSIAKNAATLADFVKACEKTPYYEPLKTAESIKSDFFSIAMMLDRLYYTELWRAKDELPKSEKEIFADFVGPSIDMLNIMWIYRGKKYFYFDNEIIYTYLIPVRYRLSEELTRNLVEASSPEKIVELVSRTRYAPLFKGVGDLYFVEENSRRFENKLAKRIFVNQPLSMAAVFAYFKLKEVEIFNITTITEGIRYNLNPDLIRKHAGG